MIIAIAMLSQISIPRSKANAFPIITPCPRVSCVDIGETFSVSFMCLDVQNLYTYQVYLNFSKEILEAINVTKGKFLSRGGAYDTFWYVRIQNDKGRIMAWESLLLPDPAVDGSGVFFSVTFRVKKAGYCEMPIYNTQLVNNAADEIGHDVVGGIVTTESERSSVVHPVVWDDETYNVTTESDACVMLFDFNHTGKYILFNMFAPTQFEDLVIVTIPKSLMWGYFFVFVNDIPESFGISGNQTHTTIQFMISFQSMQQVKIQSTGVVPEFPSVLILPLFMLATFIVTLAYRRKRAKPD